MTVIERYLELGLRLGKHADQLVESYLGPSELAARVDAEQPAPPERLVAEADALLARLPQAELEPARCRWLEAQVRSLRTTAGRLAGETLSYDDEVELLFGIRPRWYDESHFERASSLLDEALPGTGDVGERLARWIDASAVPTDVLLPAMRSIAEELRERTRELVGLPEGESIEYELVSGKPWTGFNLALGGLRSRISVNTDLPFPAFDLAYFFAHEGYPGHHADGAWKEQVLVRERGQLEATMVLLCSPASVVAEGIAEHGPELVLGPEEQELIARHLAPFGIEHDAAVAAKVVEARALLKLLPSNLAILRVARGKSRDEVFDYARRWSPQPLERIEKTLDSIDRRPFNGYVHCYPEGRRLCAAFVGDDPGRFKQLLVGQFVPADLEPDT